MNYNYQMYVIKNVVTKKYSSGEISRTSNIEKATIYDERDIERLTNYLGKNERLIKVKIVEA